MIYTATFNPALDYVVNVNHFTPGMVNRTVKENIYCEKIMKLYQTL